ncbi:aspartate--ammonia ligase [candidate division KSB1 bacterium]|nr:MAG: aspartate--ammonia ligase [candidate division KSB1 bacterium]
MKSQVIIPKGYKPALSLKETEKAIREIKEFFQTNLSFELNLVRVTAPIFVRANTGINDTLNNVERPVSFPIKDLGDVKAEIVHSLAKWKRLMLAEYGFKTGEGLYTDMNAIRADEALDNIHSLYVDQWDWEKVISAEQRNLEFLKSTVNKIYNVIVRTEKYICYKHENLTPFLPEQITFIHTEELEQEYPELTPQQREYEACKKYGAIFVTGIGHPLKNGQPHDGRAPDYDDWSTRNKKGFLGLNGDIIVYYPVLDIAYELSSMGIRVDKKALLRQLGIRNEQDKKKLYFHKQLLEGKLPLSIGGGIGQSRLCMLYLHKAHIGEIQSSIWPEDMIKQCRKHNIFIL